MSGHNFQAKMMDFSLNKTTNLSFCTSKNTAAKLSHVFLKNKTLASYRFAVNILQIVHSKQVSTELKYSHFFLDDLDWAQVIVKFQQLHTKTEDHEIFQHGLADWIMIKKLSVCSLLKHNLLYAEHSSLVPKFFSMIFFHMEMKHNASFAMFKQCKDWDSKYQNLDKPGHSQSAKRKVHTLELYLGIFLQYKSVSSQAVVDILLYITKAQEKDFLNLETILLHWQGVIRFCQSR